MSGRPVRNSAPSSDTCRAHALAATAKKKYGSQHTFVTSFPGKRVRRTEEAEERGVWIERNEHAEENDRKHHVDDVA